MAAKHPAPHAPAPASKGGSPAAATPKFLVTPQNPIAGGDAVPVGIKITSDWLNKKANSPSLVTAKLLWNGNGVAVFTVGKLALGELKQDVKFATRIKISADAPKGKLSVEVTPDGHDELKANQSVDLEITKCDDCSPNHGQLVLATQPAPFVEGQSVAVKAYVPKPAPASRVLTTIDCLFDRQGHQPLPPPQPLPAYELIRVDVTKAELLADEAFLAVNFSPSKSGLLEMSWTYKDAHANNGAATNLQACAYLTQTQKTG